MFRVEPVRDHNQWRMNIENMSTRSSTMTESTGRMIVTFTSLVLASHLLRFVHHQIITYPLRLVTQLCETRNAHIVLCGALGGPWGVQMRGWVRG